jgi:simple sugar transport system ATP-binding protein
MEVADRVVVLRAGRVVAERRTADTSRRELANLMVGRDVLERLDKRPGAPGEPRLEILGLSVRGDRGLEAVRELSLSARSGEIVGLAGVSGNGQRELADALFGLRPFAGGSVRVGGRPLPAASPAAAVAAGMARVPEDRMETGLVMDLSVQENLVLERHASADLARRGLMRFAAIGQLCERLIGEYSVKAAGRDAPARTLSGGNLQKLILARELSNEPAVVVAAQPTRGLDVGAMEYVHQRLLAERDRGAAILLVSDDLDEVFAICDRVAVIYEGRIVGEGATGEVSREQVGLWMSGVRE